MEKGVLTGVGVDGGRRDVPPFWGFLRCPAFCFAFLRFSSLFLFFFVLNLSENLLGQEQTTAIYWKNGEFHSDPVQTLHEPRLKLPAFGEGSEIGKGCDVATALEICSEGPFTRINCKRTVALETAERMK